MFFGALRCFLVAATMGGISVPTRQASSLAPVRPATAAASVSDPGQSVYEPHCAICHGTQGNGQGPAAHWLFPPARDFSAGLFKIQSTPAGSLPTDDDLFATLTRGMPGSSMPGFVHLTERQRRDVIQYIKRLATYTDGNGVTTNRFEEARQRGQPTTPIRVPAEPPATPQSLAKGEALYVRMQCFSCHGETGMGDGPSAPFLIDYWGSPAPPRDFTAGHFRGGSDGRELYLRIATGLSGTPMPPFGEEVLDDLDRWALVQHIQSLRRHRVGFEATPLATNSSIHARKLPATPVGPMDPAWDNLPAARLQLDTEHKKPGVIAVVIRAAHDGTNVVLRLQWRSPLPNQAPARIEDFHASARLGGLYWHAVHQQIQNAGTTSKPGECRGIWCDGYWNLALTWNLKTGCSTTMKSAAGKPIPFTLVIQDDPPRGSQGRKLRSPRCHLVLEP